MYTSLEAVTYSNTPFFNMNLDWTAMKTNLAIVEDTFTYSPFGIITERWETGQIKFKFNLQNSSKNDLSPCYNSSTNDKDEFSSILNDWDVTSEESSREYFLSSSGQKSGYTSCQIERKTDEKTPNSSVYSDDLKDAFTSKSDNYKYQNTFLTADLNQLVDFILDSTPSGTDDDQINPITIKAEGSKKRMRKSIYQMKVLCHEYKRNNNWDKEHINVISKKTGLSHYQVYKWFWEQEKKKKN